MGGGVDVDVAFARTVFVEVGVAGAGDGDVVGEGFLGLVGAFEVGDEVGFLVADVVEIFVVIVVRIVDAVVAGRKVELVGGIGAGAGEGDGVDGFWWFDDDWG